MSKEINHDESFELEGKWQFCGSNVTVAPNESVKDSNKTLVLTDKEVRGTLTYDADKKSLILKVFSLGEDRIILKYNSRDSVCIPFIHGLANLKKGRQVSLNQNYVYLYDYYLLPSFMVSPVLFAGPGLLLGDEPLIKEENLDNTSWKNIHFKKATVEYKNLSYWDGGRRIENNFQELYQKMRSGEDPILKIELSTKLEELEISNTLTHRNYVNNSVHAFRYGLQGYPDIKTTSVIDFDLGEKGTRFEDILDQVDFLRMLLHFAMLPRMSTYILSMSVFDEKGNEYKLLRPTSYLPKREGGTGSSPLAPFLQDFFVPSLRLEHIGTCFEKYKDNKRARLLFDLFTKPSYLMGRGSNIGTDVIYLYMFMSLECAYRLIEGKREEEKIGHEEMVKFFYKDEYLRNFIQQIKPDSKVLEVLKKEKLHEEICKIRNDFVHVKTDLLERSALEALLKDEQEKISVMYECLTYQIQRQLFELSDKEIIEVLTDPDDPKPISPFPRYPWDEDNLGWFNPKD